MALALPTKGGRATLPPQLRIDALPNIGMGLCLFLFQYTIFSLFITLTDVMESKNHEFEILKSQIVISSWGGTRKMPFAFTEYGVAMLSSVLRSKRAIQVNIQIMQVFSKVREMLLDTLSIKLDIEEIKNRLNNQDKNLELVFSYLDELIEKREKEVPRNPVGFKRSRE